MAVKNVLTGEIVTKVNVDKLVSCMKEDSDACAKFDDDRLRNRSTLIHSTTSFEYLKFGSQSKCQR